MKKIKMIISILLITLLMGCDVDEVSFMDAYNEDVKSIEYTGEMIFEVGDRKLTLEDTPVNIAEELIINEYYYDISHDFDMLKTTRRDNETNQERLKSKAADYEMDVYILEYIVHDINTISKFDVANVPPEIIEMVGQTVFKYGFDEFILVSVDVTHKSSEVLLSSGPQHKDGRYEHIFLIGKSGSDDGLKIFEVYSNW